MWRRFLLLLGLLSVLALSPAATAEAPAGGGPVGIVVETGAAHGIYHIGERVELRLTVDRDAYVWVYNVSAAGEMKQVFPNVWEEDNLLHAGVTRAVPGTSAYSFVAAPPLGSEQVVVVGLARLPGGADPTQAGVAVATYEVRPAVPGGGGPIL